MTKVTMKLEDLTCPSCMAKIEGAMLKTQGVRGVKVLFNASKVKAEFEEELVSADQLVSKIEKLGYPVLSSKTAAM